MSPPRGSRRTRTGSRLLASVAAGGAGTWPHRHIQISSCWPTLRPAVTDNPSTSNARRLMWCKWRWRGGTRVVARWGGAAGVAGVLAASLLAAGAPSASAATINDQVAFQANTGHLYTYDPANKSSTDGGLGMKAGTSPSFAGGEVAFQANTGHLYTYDPANKSSTDAGLGMAAATSPAIAANGSGHEVAFQANTGHLYTYDPANKSSTDTGLGMKAGTSPTITPPAPTPLQTMIVDAAKSQVGYQDDPSGTYCNKFTAYWGAGTSCGNGNSQEEWCADFAAWTWQQAGVSFTFGYDSGDINGAAASFYTWAAAHGTWHAAGSGYTPQPGDAVIYGLVADTSSGNWQGWTADHVAIVTSYTPGDAGPNVVNGDWWSSGNGAAVAASDQTTATGSDSISGYASP